MLAVSMIDVYHVQDQTCIIIYILPVYNTITDISYIVQYTRVIIGGYMHLHASFPIFD